MLVVTLSVLGKGLGLLRELESARLFGVSVQMDAFIAASTLIFFVARMAADSLRVSIPGLIGDYKAQNLPIPWGDLFRALLCLSIFLMLLALLVLPLLVPVLFGGFAQSEQRLTLQLLNILVPTIAGWTLIGALGGILNTQYHYGKYQIALMVASTGVLVTLWLWAKQRGIAALGWGWSFGLGLGTVALVIPLWHQVKQIRVWRGWERQWHVLRRLLTGTGGLSIWFVLNQMPVWIERYYAAELSEGSLSALGFAQRLFQLPLEMVTAVVMSVWIARVVEIPRDRLARHTFRLMGRLAIVSFPIAFLLAFLARPAVTLVFERGAFDAQAVKMTSGPFAMYALGLGFHVLSAVLVRTFQARGLVRYPLIAVVLDIILIGLLNTYSFRQGWGATGIALINTSVAGVRVLLLGICMRILKF